MDQSQHLLEMWNCLEESDNFVSETICRSCSIKCFSFLCQVVIQFSVSLGDLCDHLLLC